MAPWRHFKSSGQLFSALNKGAVASLIVIRHWNFLMAIFANLCGIHIHSSIHVPRSLFCYHQRGLVKAETGHFVIGGTEWRSLRNILSRWIYWSVFHCCGNRGRTCVFVIGALTLVLVLVFQSMIAHCNYAQSSTSFGYAKLLFWPIAIVRLGPKHRQQSCGSAIPLSSLPHYCAFWRRAAYLCSKCLRDYVTSSRVTAPVHCVFFWGMGVFFVCILIQTVLCATYRASHSWLPVRFFDMGVGLSWSGAQPPPPEWGFLCWPMRCMFGTARVVVVTSPVCMILESPYWRFKNLNGRWLYVMPWSQVDNSKRVFMSLCYTWKFKSVTVRNFFRAVINISLQGRKKEFSASVGEIRFQAKSVILCLSWLNDFPGKVSADNWPFEGSRSFQAIKKQRRKAHRLWHSAMYLQIRWTSLNPLFHVVIRSLKPLKTHQGVAKKNWSARHRTINSSGDPQRQIHV